MFLKHYEGLFDHNNPSSALMNRRLRNSVSRGRSVLRAMIAGSEGWHASKGISDHADVLIVSHLVNAGFAGQSKDFYFGDLADKLAINGVKIVIALIDYTGQNPKGLVSRWDNALVPRVVLANALSFNAERGLQKDVSEESARLRRKGMRSHGLARTVALRAAEEVRGGACLHAMRIGEQVRRLVAYFKPHSLITTYEGHSWERIAYARGRQVQPDIHCIGYQHAGLFPHQHAALRPLSPQFNPDTILAAGHVGLDAMRSNLQLADINIDCIGSVRSTLRASPANNESVREACLVVPEGDLRECGLLFGFSLGCAIQLPALQFIWRLHPNTRYEELLKKYPKFGKLPANVKISSEQLTDDISRSRWVLYRGSTAVIQAVTGGAFPIYVHQEGEVSIDTLYELGSLRKICMSENEFVRFVSEISEENISAGLAEIQKACERMFVALDAQRLNEILKVGKSFHGHCGRTVGANVIDSARGNPVVKADGCR